MLAIENKEPQTISPTHPGEMLREDFLFWLNAQRAYDLWQAKRDNQTEIDKIKPLRAA
jgi:plasmid maintenance system antidote protein VapI